MWGGGNAADMNPAIYLGLKLSSLCLNASKIRSRTILCPVRVLHPRSAMLYGSLYLPTRYKTKSTSSPIFLQHVAADIKITYEAISSISETEM